MLRKILRAACFATSFPLSVGLPGFVQAADWGGHKVGHTIMSVTLQGSAGEFRPLDILIWYPANPKSYRNAPPSTYKPWRRGL